jgi:hypothetical protein
MVHNLTKPHILQSLHFVHCELYTYGYCMCWSKFMSSRRLMSHRQSGAASVAAVSKGLQNEYFK